MSRSIGRYPRWAASVSVIAATVLSLATIGVGKSQANTAYWRYHTTTAVNLHWGPSTTANFSPKQSVGAGTPVDIVCQAYSQWQNAYVYNNNVWDRLTGGQWVSDEFVNTPGHGWISLRPC